MIEQICWVNAEEMRKLMSDMLFVPCFHYHKFYCLEKVLPMQGELGAIVDCDVISRYCLDESRDGIKQILWDDSVPAAEKPRTGSRSSAKRKKRAQRVTLFEFMLHKRSVSLVFALSAIMLLVADVVLLCCGVHDWAEACVTAAMLSASLSYLAATV